MKASWTILAVAAWCVALTRGLAVNANPAPLPPVETVLERIIEKSRSESENDKAFKERYHYTRSKATEYRNSSGDLKSREAKTSVNRPNAVPAAHPVPPSGTGAAVSAPATSQTPINTNSTAFEKKEFLVNTNLLNRFQFTMVGRELVAGRPALVIDFIPAKTKQPEPTLKDRFINKAAGRVWVDEADSVLAKASFRLTEKVNLVGGLVGSVSKFTFTFDRERTEDGLWFTRLANWHLEAREVIFNRVIDFEEKKTDVKKAW